MRINGLCIQAISVPHPPTLGLGGAIVYWRLFYLSLSVVRDDRTLGVSVTPIFFLEALLQLAKLSPLNSRPVGQDLFPGLFSF